MARKITANVVAPHVEDAVQPGGDGRRTRALRCGCRVEAVIEDDLAAVVQHRAHGQDVVRNHAVEDRVRARAIVAHRAADGGPAAAGRVGAKHPTNLARGCVEVIQHQARLAADPVLRGVDFQHPVQMLGGIQHHSVAHSLTGQAGASAARQHGGAVAGADLDHSDDLGGIARNNHPNGFDLVEAGIGAVEHATGCVEAHVQYPGAAQVGFQSTGGIGGNSVSIGGHDYAIIRRDVSTG